MILINLSSTQHDNPVISLYIVYIKCLSAFTLESFDLGYWCDAIIILIKYYVIIK